MSASGQTAIQITPLSGDGAYYYPVLVVITFAALITAFRGRQAASFWLVCAAAVWSILWRDFNATHDGLHHLYRIVELSTQLKKGQLNLLVQNNITHETLPVFVYYSIIPYLPAVLLNFSGLAPEPSFTITLVLYFSVLAFGIQDLIQALGKDKYPNAYAFGAMFLASNYILGDWLVRAAFAELTVYAIVPWITAALCRRKIRIGWLTFLITMQMAVHPIVVLHAMIAQTLPALLLSRAPAVQLISRFALASCLALLASAAFWGPAYYSQDGILAGAGLSKGFLDSFLYARELLDPTHFKTTGISVLAMGALATGAAIYRRDVKLLAYAAAAWMILLLQLRVMMPATTALPLLEESALIWRLMFAFAFVVFTLLVATFGGRDFDARTTIAAVLLNMSLFYMAQMSTDITAPWRSQSSEQINQVYSVPERTWGGLEFYPNYDELADVCGLLQTGTLNRLDYAQVRVGANAMPGYTAIKAAPDAFVRWTFGGAAINPAGKCVYDLILGPFQTAGPLRSDETFLNRILLWRLLTIAGLVLTGAGFCLRMLRGKPATCTAASVLQQS